MGCIETKRTPPSVVIPTTASAPIYVKSALKNSRGSIMGRSQRLSESNREIPTFNKSVNFDEKVEVKLRTPTPKLMDYDIPPSPTMPTRRRLSNNNDDDEIGSTHSSVSSQEDFNNGQLKTASSVSSFPTLQRNYSNNSSWHRSNSIAVIPSINNTNEKHPPPPLGGIQQPPVNINSYPTENPIMPRGKPFKVRRKTTYPVLPESSPEPSAEPSYHPPVQSAPVPVKRPLPNTNAVFVDHRASFPNNELPSQPVYYSFTRRPKTNPDLTEN